MLQPVHPVLLRLEGQQGVEEVGHAEAAVGPAAEVRDEQGEVVGVVREGRGQGLMAAVMRADMPAAASWLAASGTEPSWTWRACRAVAAALSWSHSGELAEIGAVVVIAVVVIVSRRLSV